MKTLIYSQKMQKNITLVLFLFIPTILLVLFVIFPLAKLFQLSWTDWNGIDQTVNYIGADNYKEVFIESSNVWLSLRNNGIYFVIHLLVIPVEIFIAYVLDMKIRGSEFFRKLFFMPYIINGVAVSYMFAAFFAPDYSYGALDMILKFFKQDHLVRGWLSDPGIVNLTLVFVSVWRFMGFHIILFIAGMQSIPRELFEAADVDGAKVLQKFRYIVIPSITLVTEIILFLNIRGALQVFDIPFVITSGGPGHASSTFTLFTIETAFKFNSFGKAAAMAITLFLMIIFLSKIQSFIFKGRKG